MREESSHNLTNPVKCLVVDDEPLAVQLVESHIEQVPRLKLIASCLNSLEAFELLKKEQIDLIFLDIEMPVLTGIDFVKSLQSPPAIIFTTANRNYAAESYELSVIDYLVKPIEFSRFFTAVNKFLDQNDSKPSDSNVLAEKLSESDYIYVNSNKKYIKIEYKQILFIESLKDYLRIHTIEKSIITKDKISDFEGKLPSSFLRIHRSFIVNADKITAYTMQDIEINEKEIPIGRSYKEEVLEYLRSF